MGYAQSRRYTEECLAFLDELDGALSIDLTEWETNFLESIMKHRERTTIFTMTDRQIEVCRNLQKKYQPLITREQNSDGSEENENDWIE